MAVTGAQFWTDTFIRSTGVPYSGVRVFHYAAGGSVSKDIWEDEGKLVALAQPFVGDASGRVAFYGDGDYRLEVRSSLADGDTLIYNWDNVKIVGKAATLRAENQATSFPPASAANRGQQFFKTDGLGNMVSFGIQTGSGWQDVQFAQAATAGTVSWNKGSNLASASTLTLGSDGNAWDVSGNTTITAITEKPAGTLILLRTLASLTFQYNSTSMILPNEGNLITQANDLVMFLSLGSGNWQMIPPGPDVAVQSAGRFAFLSGTQCLFQRHNGAKVPIAGRLRLIPSAGVVFSNASLSASTTYFAYVFMNAGVMTGELSATVPAVSATTGYKIKTGDETRTLVGMVRTTSGSFFADSVTQRFVASYFNRQRKAASNGFAATRTKADGTYVEISSGERAEFVTWTDDAVTIAASGNISNNTAATSTYTSIGIDGITPEDVYVHALQVVGATYPFGLSMSKALTDGYHYATLIGHVSGGTGAWAGSGTPGFRTTIYVGLNI